MHNQISTEVSKGNIILSLTIRLQKMLKEDNHSMIYERQGMTCRFGCEPALIHTQTVRLEDDTAFPFGASSSQKADMVILCHSRSQELRNEKIKQKRNEEAAGATRSVQLCWFDLRSEFKQAHVDRNPFNRNLHSSWYVFLPLCDKNFGELKADIFFPQNRSVTGLLALFCVFGVFEEVKFLQIQLLWTAARLLVVVTFLWLQYTHIHILI